MLQLKSKVVMPDGNGGYTTKVLVQQESPTFRMFEETFEGDQSTKTDDELIAMAKEALYKDLFPNRAENEAIEAIRQENTELRNLMTKANKAVESSESTVKETKESLYTVFGLIEQIAEHVGLEIKLGDEEDENEEGDDENVKHDEDSNVPSEKDDKGGEGNE